MGGGTAAERRQRQEIEGLKATIERAKLDAEAAKKKARASERRCESTYSTFLCVCVCGRA